MEIKNEGNNKTICVMLDGDLDHHNASSVKREIDKVLERCGAKNIVFDFKNVSFMDSSGIGMIMGRYRKISGVNGKIFIKNAGKEVRRIIGISGLGGIINEYDNWGGKNIEQDED